MTPLFLYLLKVNIALLLFYLAYRYGLRRLTFYTLNRFFLLFAIGFSSVYPLIDIGAFIRAHDIAGGEVIYYLPNLNSLAENNPLEIWNVLAIVFWSGVVIMALRFVVQCGSLLHIHLISVKQETEKQPIRAVRKKINPFSFFRNIYMNPQLHSPEDRRSIIEHERVHINEWHTADVLAGELNRIFYWFNPGAWLIMTAIRENLEFITDRKVLREGADIKAYQYSLVKAGNIPYASSLANNFNFSHLKIRITMMDKKPSSELHLLKYLVLVPVVAATTLAVNASKIEFTPPVVKLAEVTGVIPAGSDTLPEKAGNRLDSPPPPPVVKEVRFTPPTVIRKDEDKKQPSSSKAREEKDIPPPVVKGVRFGPATAQRPGSAATEPSVKEVRFGPATEPVVKEVRFGPQDSTRKEPLLIVDGEIMENSDLEQLDPNKIASISVLKDDKATALYGKKAKDGAILIITKKNAVNNNDESTESTAPSDDLEPIVKMGYPFPVDEDILYLLDGKTTTLENVKKLPHEDIESVNVLKGESATDKYGKKGEHGVIEISTKKE